MMKLKNKVAVVTGGSRGIGKAIVLELCQKGAKVAFFYKENSKAANDLAAEIKRKNREVLALKVDVSKPEIVTKGFDKIIKKFKKIDIVVNNAATVLPGNKLLFNMPKQDWDTVINTNLTGLFNVTKIAVFFLIKQRKGGAIINVSSIGACKPIIGQSNYNASKAGVIGFTKSIALEVARFGITVNSIAPGPIATEMIDTLPKKFKEDILNFVPLKRYGKPEEVAKLVAFLASDDAKYITGENIIIDGGLCLK